MMFLPNSADAHDYLIIEKSNCNKEVKASRSLCKSINFKISSIFYLVHKKEANALEKAVDWLTRKLWLKQKKKNCLNFFFLPCLFCIARIKCALN